MQIGVVFPHYEIEPDAVAIKEFAQGVEDLGFAHINAVDHVIGANRASRPDWSAPYDASFAFHEPLTLFSYMAGLTARIGFVTGILILPQRQTVLVAKQAACLDVLSGGRLRLGVAIGWNAVEYVALGVPFTKRGSILEDQIGVLRSLWTQRAVTVKTDYHAITDAGINPLPMQQPIPVWMGGGSSGTPIPGGISGLGEKPLRRIARLADGWMPTFMPDDVGAEQLAKFQGFCREYGRDPAKIGLEAFVLTKRNRDSEWIDTLNRWRKLGATHVNVSSMADGLTGVAQHLRPSGGHS
jgi:probable F420-dependent oxidoreductase